MMDASTPRVFVMHSADPRCLVDNGAAQLAEIDAHAPVAVRVAPMTVALTRLDTLPPVLDTLPPVHEDLDDTLGFLGGKALAQVREQLRLISAYNEEHLGHLPAFPIQSIVAPEGWTVNYWKMRRA
jgi:hypothetical protein